MNQSRSEQFDSLGLVAGTVVGARSFEVDKLGRLTGIHYSQIWHPGENVAECRKVDDVAALNQVHRQMIAVTDAYFKTAQSYSWTAVRRPGPRTIYDRILGTNLPNVPLDITPAIEEAKRQEILKPQPEPPRPPHDYATCQCGFYGYYDGSNDYGVSRDAPGGMYWATGSATYRISAIIEGYGETVIGTRGFRATKARILGIYIPEDIRSAMRRLVERNYAGTPFYDSFQELIEAHPTTAGEAEIRPDNTPDFWTRKI